MAACRGGVGEHNVNGYVFARPDASSVEMRLGNGTFPVGWSQFSLLPEQTAEGAFWL